MSLFSGNAIGMLFLHLLTFLETTSTLSAISNVKSCILLLFLLGALRQRFLVASEACPGTHNIDYAAYAF